MWNWLTSYLDLDYLKKEKAAFAFAGMGMGMGMDIYAVPSTSTGRRPITEPWLLAAGVIPCRQSADWVLGVRLLRRTQLAALAPS
jgi:hypothetical protein